MAEFHFNEGMFQIPDSGVVDRSTTALEIAVRGKRVTAAIGRAPREGAPLEEVLEKSLKVMAVSFRRLRHEPPKLGELGPYRAAQLELTFMHESGPMYNRVAIVECDDLVLTLTVAGTDDLRGPVTEIFGSLLASLKFRRRR